MTQSTKKQETKRPAEANAPELMTEEELVSFLRIPQVSKSGNYSNVIENLKRMHGLPCIHICKKPLYPLNAVREWIKDKVAEERTK